MITLDPSVPEYFINKPNFFQLPVKEASINGVLFEISHFFLSGKMGDIVAFGSDSGQEFRFVGELEPKGDVGLHRYFKSYEIGTHWHGKIELTEQNSGYVTISGKNSEGDINIVLDLDKWIGYYEQGGTNHEMKAGFKFGEEKVVGFSWDSIGYAIWNGSRNGDSVTFEKFYLGQHTVDYAGVLSKNGELREFKGKYWDSGDFYFSHLDS